MSNYNILYNKILIFDGSYALHRSLCVSEQFNMSTTTGIHTGGIYGVLRIIQKELRTFNYFPIVVFDGGLSLRRLNIFPNYKRNLEKQQLLECVDNYKTEQQLLDEEFMREYRTQRNVLMEFLPLLGIPTIRIQNWEGDDLIYLLSKMSLDSVVVSDDKDLIQLIDYPNSYNSGRTCRIRRALNDELWDIETLQKQNTNIQQYIGCKSIVGDPSDNLNSACNGVGPKTALGLYKLIEYTQAQGIQFPQTEEELDKYCRHINISKRKAYLNLNLDQFIENYLMTDLRFVDKDVTDDVLSFIKQKIETDINNLNQDKQNEIIEVMDCLEFKYFNIEALKTRLKEVENCFRLPKML